MQLVVANHSYPTVLYNWGSYSFQLSVVANSYNSSVRETEAQANLFYVVNSVSNNKHSRAASKKRTHALCCKPARVSGWEVPGLGGTNSCCLAGWSCVNLPSALPIIA